MSRTTVEEIKARIPVEDLVGSYVKLDRAGKSFKGKCPFHNEKTASFFVSPERGGYYCFGCGAKGDIFNFVEQFEGLDFKGALKVLADKAGVPLVFDQKGESERDQLFRIMEDAAKFFEEQYAKSKEAQEYVNGRGIKTETREVFRVGWAPEGWNHLHDYLKKKGWSQTVMEKAGLIKGKEGSANNFYDRFRGRIMFPISDSSGRIVAFTGRILKADDKSAKYLNSPDTLLYDKSSILFGLDKAKTEIRRLNYTIMVEGQMDLIMSYQAGVKNIVAASGTAISDESVNKQGIINNFGLVRRLSPNVIIAFDSDAPGRKAAFRAAGIALSLGMDVKMADIVGGKDPADLVKENPEIWKEILRTTKPVVEFELLNVLRDEKDPRKLPRELRARVFPLLASIESRTDQDFFVRMIADRANIDAGAIWDDLRAVRKKMEIEASVKTSPMGRGLEPATAPADPEENVLTGASSARHTDLVERRMFGLLNLIKKEDEKKYAEYLAEVEKTAGGSFKERSERVSREIEDMSFEAEAIYGSDKDKWDTHMKELILNFGLDIVNEELIQAMQELRIAEKAGNQLLVAELAKKCQALSLRKAVVGKRVRG
jgi:DNA primase